jgi:hypothetical protein
LDFEVTGSADGAANTVANDFKILNFGCFSINKKGICSFRPFIYLLFPAEVEIYFAIGIVTLLKHARRLFSIRDIHFKGMLVSNHAGTFVNVYKLAFPISVAAQCYPHILRNFSKGTGNGCYCTKAKSKKFFAETMQEDVRSLYHCLSRPMFGATQELANQVVKARRSRI